MRLNAFKRINTVNYTSEYKPITTFLVVIPLNFHSNISAMAFPLPTGFDPSMMMEYLATPPQEYQTRFLQDAMGKVGEYQEQAQQSRTREGLIKRFKEARARFIRPGGAFAEELKAGQIKPDGAQVSFSNTNAKPNFDMRSLKSLKPMIGHELVVGTTHRGRYLCGWLLTTHSSELRRPHFY